MPIPDPSPAIVWMYRPTRPIGVPASSTAEFVTESQPNLGIGKTPAT